MATTTEISTLGTGYYSTFVTPYSPSTISTRLNDNGQTLPTTITYVAEPQLASYNITSTSVTLQTYISTVGVTPSTSPSTTTSTSSTSTSSTSGSVASAKTGHPRSNSKISTGELAGVAIGCLIFGSIVTGLLVWLLMNSRQKKQHRAHGDAFTGSRRRSHQQTRTQSSSEKPLPTATVIPVGGGIAGSWEKHLDQPESDSTISSSVKGLFDHVEVHVENFYHDSNVILTTEMQSELMDVDSGSLPEPLPGLITKTRNPTLLIKHSIAQAIVARISPETNTAVSFLPADYVGLSQLLAVNKSTVNKPAFHQALSRFRVLAAYLRPTPQSDPAYLAVRDANIARVAETLCRAFSPWANSRETFEGRCQSLISIMKVGADTGILLFSQPGSFAWRWLLPRNRPEGQGEVLVVVTPGLVKVRDENAGEVARPKETVRPVIGALL